MSDVYVKFTEENDHEGETWVFWLQRDGNEPALVKLALIISQVDEGLGLEGPYSLDMTTILDEHDVNVLVEHGGGGYMSNHTKVTGKMKTPKLEDLAEDNGFGPELDGLYKGGITRLFR